MTDIETLMAREVLSWIPPERQLEHKPKFRWGFETKEEELRFFQEHKGNE